MLAQQEQEFIFLRGQALFFSIAAQHLGVVIKPKRADLDFTHLLIFVGQGGRPAQDGLDAHEQLFHAERLGHVVVGTDFEPFEGVFIG